MTDLKRRILDISHKKKLSHIGSCLTAVSLIDAVYQVKKEDEKFILSGGHSGLALYCVIEKYGGRNAEEIFDHHGVHPDRCKKCEIDYSTGSLGQGLPAAVGMALAHKRKNVYCLITDGECAEGSIWEALRIGHDLKLKNLKIIANVNGWGAYGKIEGSDLFDRFKAFGWDVEVVDGSDVGIVAGELSKRRFNPTIIFARTKVNQLPFLKDQDAHYHTMTEEEYESIK